MPKSSRRSPRRSPSSDSAAYTRNQEEHRKAEKDRRDKLNIEINENFKLARQVNHQLSLGIPLPDGKPGKPEEPTKGNMLEFSNKVLRQVSTQQGNAPAGQVMVPATPSATATASASFHQKFDFQIDHHYVRLNLGYYWTIHYYELPPPLKPGICQGNPNGQPSGNPDVYETGHIVLCTDGITHVNGYQIKDVMWKSPYKGFIHDEDVFNTLNEQIKMLINKTPGWVCYRIKNKITNSQGIEEVLITYQRSFCVKFIEPNFFLLLNAKIDSYTVSYNAPCSTAGPAIANSPVNSDNSYGYRNNTGGPVSLGQPGSMNVPSLTAGPAGPTTPTTQVYSENRGDGCSNVGAVSLVQPDSNNLLSLTAGPAGPTTPTTPVYSENRGGCSNMGGAVSQDQPASYYVPTWTAGPAGLATPFIQGCFNNSGGHPNMHGAVLQDQPGSNSVTSWTVGPAGPSDEWTPISPVNSELSSSAGGNVDLYEFDQLVASTIDPSSASGEGSVGVAGHLATSPTCSEDSGIWRDATEMDTFGSTDPSPFGTSYNYL